MHNRKVNAVTIYKWKVVDRRRLPAVQACGLDLMKSADSKCPWLAVMHPRGLFALLVVECHDLKSEG